MRNLLLLIIGHYVADFPLQNDFMALNKEPGKPMWKTLLLAHCAIHAGPVLLITGDCGLAIAEFFAHLITDYCKGRKWIGLGVDQVIHILCKLAWFFIAGGTL